MHEQSCRLRIWRAQHLHTHSLPEVEAAMPKYNLRTDKTCGAGVYLSDLVTALACQTCQACSTLHAQAVTLVPHGQRWLFRSAGSKWPDVLKHP